MTGIIDPREITKNLTPEQLKEFGTIIGSDNNDAQPAPTYEQPVSATPTPSEPHTVSIDHKIKHITAPVSLTLNLTPEQNERLLRLCSNNSQSPTQYITDVVLKDLESRVGRAAISGPSRIGGIAVGRKVVGPSAHVRGS